MVICKTTTRQSILKGELHSSETLYCDLLYDQQSKKITKNKAMSQLKGVKSIFESVSKVI